MVSFIKGKRIEPSIVESVSRWSKDNPDKAKTIVPSTRGANKETFHNVRGKGGKFAKKKDS